MAGWIKLDREIQNHWIFADAEKFKAWCMMIMLVNYKDKTQLIEGELILCKRGQSLFSIATWANKFGGKWTPQRVKTFFSLLEKDKMIEKKGLRKTTRLTICKYEDYQNDQPADNQEVTKRQLRDNQEVTTTKEGKESKEGNKCILLTPILPIEETKKLTQEETFNLFWDHFHKVTGKPKEKKKPAFNHWKKIKLEDQRKAYSKVESFSLSNPDKDYLPICRTYLADRVFEDEFIVGKIKIPSKETYEQTVARTVINKHQSF